ncbi:MAG: sugar nucleotide-binding protein [Magnetococcus sp. MYC-9]
MDKVLIVGASGLLGSSLSPYCTERGVRVVRGGFTAPEADIRFDVRDFAQTYAVLEEVQPDLIVNLTALTDVDLCEAQPHEAYLGNVRCVESLCRWMAANGRKCFLIHISTDTVYDGVGPHAEPDIRLTSCYAFSKYASELVALSVPSTILRTTFFGRTLSNRRKSLSDWVVESLTHGVPVKAVRDVLFSPLSISSLVQYIHLCMMTRAEGVFNLGSHHGFSKAEFIFRLASVLDLDTRLISLADASQVFVKAYRSRDTRMDVKKFETTFGVVLPSLDSEIEWMRGQYA